MHAGANASARRVPGQGAACTGRRQRKSPTGRGSEWDSFVDTQPILAYPGYAAGLRRDLLRDRDARQLCRGYENARELPSVSHWSFTFAVQFAENQDCSS